MTTFGCTICFVDFAADETLEGIGSCGHVFHFHCLEQWLEVSRQKKCPLCRVPCSKTHKIFLSTVGEKSPTGSPARQRPDRPPEEADVRVLRMDLKRMEKLMAAMETTLKEKEEKEAQQKNKMARLNQQLHIVEASELDAKHRMKQAEERVQRDGLVNNVIRAKLEAENTSLSQTIVQLAEEKAELERKVAENRMMSETEVDEKELKRLVGSLMHSNREEVLTSLQRSLLLRNKLYSDLVGDCDKLVAEKSSAERNVEMAAITEAKLRSRIESLKKEKAELHRRLVAATKPKSSTILTPSPGPETIYSPKTGTEADFPKPKAPPMPSMKRGLEEGDVEDGEEKGRIETVFGGVRVVNARKRVALENHIPSRNDNHVSSNTPPQASGEVHASSLLTAPLQKSNPSRGTPDKAHIRFPEESLARKTEKANPQRVPLQELDKNNNTHIDNRGALPWSNSSPSDSTYMVAERELEALSRSQSSYVPTYAPSISQFPRRESEFETPRTNSHSSTRPGHSDEWVTMASFDSGEPREHVVNGVRVNANPRLSVSHSSMPRVDGCTTLGLDRPKIDPLPLFGPSHPIHQMEHQHHGDYADPYLYENGHDNGPKYSDYFPDSTDGPASPSIPASTDVIEQSLASSFRLPSSPPHLDAICEGNHEITDQRNAERTHESSQKHDTYYSNHSTHQRICSSTHETHGTINQSINNYNHEAVGQDHYDTKGQTNDEARREASPESEEFEDDIERLLRDTLEGQDEEDSAPRRHPREDSSSLRHGGSRGEAASWSFPPTTSANKLIAAENPCFPPEDNDKRRQNEERSLTQVEDEEEEDDEQADCAVPASTQEDAYPEVEAMAEGLLPGLSNSLLFSSATTAPLHARSSLDVFKKPASNTIGRVVRTPMKSLNKALVDSIKSGNGGLPVSHSPSHLRSTASPSLVPSLPPSIAHPQLPAARPALVPASEASDWPMSRGQPFPGTSEFGGAVEGSKVGDGLQGGVQGGRGGWEIVLGSDERDGFEVPGSDALRVPDGRGGTAKVIKPSQQSRAPLRGASSKGNGTKSGHHNSKSTARGAAIRIDDFFSKKT